MAGKLNRTNKKHTFIPTLTMTSIMSLQYARQCNDRLTWTQQHTLFAMQRITNLSSIVHTGTLHKHNLNFININFPVHVYAVHARVCAYILSTQFCQRDVCVCVFVTVKFSKFN